MAEEDPTYDFVVTRLASGLSISQIAHELDVIPGVQDGFTDTLAIFTLFFIREFTASGAPFEVFFPVFMQTYGISFATQTYLLDTLIQLYSLTLHSPPFPAKEGIIDLMLHIISTALGGAGVDGFIESMQEDLGQSRHETIKLLLVNLSRMIVSGNPAHIPIIHMITNYFSEQLAAWPRKDIKGLRLFFQMTYGMDEEAAGDALYIYMRAYAQTLAHLGPAGAEELLRGQGYGRQFITEIFKRMSPTYADIMSNVIPFANRSIEALLSRVPANASNAALARNILRHKYRHLEAHSQREEARRLYAANMNAAAASGGSEAAVAARHPTITVNQARQTASFRRNTAAPLKPQYVHAEWTPAAEALSPAAPQHFENKEPPMGAMFEEGHPNYRVSWANQQPPISQKKRSRRNRRVANQKRGRTRGNSNNNNNNSSNSNNNNNNNNNNNAQNVNNI